MFLIVTPGPSVLVIPVGLAILGTEYAWARRWLRHGRKMAKKALSRTQKIIGAATSSANSRQQAKQRRRDEAEAGAISAAAAGHITPTEDAKEQPEELAGSSGSARDHSTIPR